MTPHQQTQPRSAEDYAAETTIVLRGLPGIGKTTLSNAIIAHMESYGCHTFQINADAVRSSLNKKLGFTLQDRNEHAARLGALCWLVKTNSYIPIVDFIMPTKTTYDAFQEGLGSTNFLIVSIEDPDFVGRFEDTQKMFQPIQEWWGGAVFGPEHFMRLPRWEPDRIDEAVREVMLRLIELSQIATQNKEIQ